MSQGIGSTALAYARVWHEINLENLILGRISTHIVSLLMGTGKPIYHPSVDCGDYVVVTNARKIKVTGKKYWEKTYRTDSGHPGGIKEFKFKDLMERKPEEIIRRSINGMLPKNHLRRFRIGRLLIFPDEHHPYALNIRKDYVDPKLRPQPNPLKQIANLYSTDLDSSLKV